MKTFFLGTSLRIPPLNDFLQDALAQLRMIMRVVVWASSWEPNTNVNCAQQSHGDHKRAHPIPFGFLRAGLALAQWRGEWKIESFLIEFMSLEIVFLINACETLFPFCTRDFLSNNCCSFFSPTALNLAAASNLSQPRSENGELN